MASLLGDCLTSPAPSTVGSSVEDLVDTINSGQAGTDKGGRKANGKVRSKASKHESRE